MYLFNCFGMLEICLYVFLDLDPQGEGLLHEGHLLGGGQGQGTRTEGGHHLDLVYAEVQVHEGVHHHQDADTHLHVSRGPHRHGEEENQVEKGIGKEEGHPLHLLEEKKGLPLNSFCTWPALLSFLLFFLRPELQ